MEGHLGDRHPVPSDLLFQDDELKSMKTMGTFMTWAMKIISMMKRTTMMKMKSTQNPRLKRKVIVRNEKRPGVEEGNRVLGNRLPEEVIDTTTTMMNILRRNDRQTDDRHQEGLQEGIVVVLLGAEEGLVEETEWFLTQTGHNSRLLLHEALTPFVVPCQIPAPSRRPQ